MTRKITHNKSLQIFLYALILATILFLPFIIWEKGYYFFTGDFNVQQVPFYQLAHAAVRSGDWFWNWNTDLGANFIGSYSFYLITSPFFWLTLPFPNSFVPQLMGPLLILKLACASLTGYTYLKRFTKDYRYAMLGSLLYGFSGFCIYNTFFNHFLEVVVFFPLMLVGLEDLIRKDRKGLFAVTVAINAFVNYWFFIGEVVFVVIYYAVRCTDKEHFPKGLQKFWMVALESVIGVLLAAFILLPSVLALLGNPRTGLSDLQQGWNFWVYWQERRPMEILYNMFFPPDLVYNSFLFGDQAAKWSSLSVWIPLFSMSGVIAYVQSRKQDWLKKLLAICLLMAFIPGFNSLFVMLNQSYYARWYYMPILMICLATVLALEKPEIDLRRGQRWTAVITIGFILAIGLTPVRENDQWSLGLFDNAARYAIVSIIAVACLILTNLLLTRFREEGEHRFLRVTAAVTSAIILVCGMTFLTIGKVMNSPTGEWIVEHAIEGKDRLQLPDDEFARSDFYEAMDNMGMYWQLPNIQAFHSIVPVSIMEFYPEVGVKRDVSSKPSTEYYQLRSLLSVKWLFIEEGNEEQSPMPGYTYVDTQNGFNIYENENFLPMGFAYDGYISREDFNDATTSTRVKMLLKGIVLEEEDAKANSDILPKLDPDVEDYSYDGYVADVEDLRRQSTSEFQKDNRGFTAKIDLDHENLVFFSVPYEQGWSATVNGEPAEIIRVNLGFMAVRCPQGESEIRFNYMTPGLIPGLILTAAGILMLLCYLALFGVRRMISLRPEPEIGKVVPDQFSNADSDWAESGEDDSLQSLLFELDKLDEEEGELSPRPSVPKPPSTVSAQASEQPPQSPSPTPSHQEEAETNHE